MVPGLASSSKEGLQDQPSPANTSGRSPAAPEESRTSAGQPASAAQAKDEMNEQAVAPLKNDLVRRSRRRKRHEVEVETKTLWELQRRYSELSAAAEIYSIQCALLLSSFLAVICRLPARVRLP